MLIGLTGKKQAGKDTVQQRIERLLGPESTTGARVERVSFADRLYESAAAALDVGTDFLRQWKSIEVAGLVVVTPAADGKTLQASGLIPFRQYLRRYGTEAHRDVFGQDFWVNAVDLSDHERKIVVVTDVRFPNEANAVIDAGGTVVRVLGTPEAENAVDDHVSESPLAEVYVDDVIDNSVRNDGYRHLDAQVYDLALRLFREGR